MTAPPRHQLPAATRLGVVRLQVGDLERSVAYYERVLGLRVRERRADGAVLSATGEHALIELRERAGAKPVQRYRTLGLYHFAILLPDRGSLGRFLAHLATLGAQVAMSDHGVSEAIYLWDPDGLGIEVYADRPRSTWRYHDSELAMTTLPLDAEDVVRAGGGSAWDGMPAGTVMGHVHLHVGDLPRAEAFYHAAFGFDITARGYPQALFMSAGGYHHHLATNTWARGGASPTAEDAQLLEWEVELPAESDVRATASRLRAAGFEATESGGGFIAQDPWGTTVRCHSERSSG